MKLNDLSGQRFGWVTVLERDYDYAKINNLKKKETYWKCQCDCGKIFTTRGYSLTRGSTRSCGCFKTTNQEDLTGLHKGQITILGPDFEYTKTHSGAYWKCKCNCGNIFSQSTNWINKTIEPHCPNCMSRNYEDLTGQQFHFLTVLERDYNYSKEKQITPGIYWKCKCICGKIVTVRDSSLKSNTTMSCGCKRLELTRNAQMNNIAGQHFGKLIAIEPDFNYADEHNLKNSGHTIYWKCLCECGEICIKPYNDLKKGKSVNCPSCAQKSKAEEHIKRILIDNNINFIYNKEYFKDLIGNNGILRYDFILLQNNVPYRLIEYDGPQHYYPIDYFGGEERFKLQQKYDELKNEYAKKNNIPLIRIPYTEKNITLDLILSEKYLV